MKTALPFAFVLLFSLLGQTLQAQEFVWSRLITGIRYAKESILEDDGTSYLGGTYTDTAVFGSQKVGSLHPGFGRGNAFIAKYDPAGRLIRVFGASGDVQLINMCKDRSGHIYLVGAFEGSVSIGGIPLTADVGIFSYFTAKCDTLGNFYWARAYTNLYNGGFGNYRIRVGAIGCDLNDSLYILGDAWGPYNGNGISFTGSETGVFVSKVEPLMGGGIWTKTIGGNAYKTPIKVFTDRNNDVIIAGDFRPWHYKPEGQICTFNNGTDSVSVEGRSNRIFVAKYSTDGTYKWAQALGINASGNLREIVCDSNNNLFVSGEVSNEPGGYSNNLGIVKLNPAGSVMWKKRLSNAEYVGNLAMGGKFLYTGTIFTDSFRYEGGLFTKAGQHNALLKIDTATGDLPVGQTPPLLSPSYAIVSANNRGQVFYCGDGSTTGLKFGNSFLYNNGADFTYVSLLTDSSFLPAGSSRIMGNIYEDANLNCLKEPAEPPLAQYSVIAQPGPYYGVTDTAGNYAIRVPVGTYQVQALASIGHHVKDSLACAPIGYSVNIPSNGAVDTGNNFGFRYQKCFFLNIDSRRSEYFCGGSQLQTYHICNLGLDTAKNTVFTIKYPKSVIMPLVSYPLWTTYSTADTTLTFNLGNLPPDSCVVIRVSDTVRCTVNNYYGPKEAAFKIKVTPLNECFAADTCNNSRVITNLIIGHTIGVSAAEKALPVPSVFPNPTSGTITIRDLAGNEKITVYNLFGQQVSTVVIQGQQEVRLDLTAQSTGVYFVFITSKTGVAVHKLIRL